jgi:hypothetical protein
MMMNGGGGGGGGGGRRWLVIRARELIFEFFMIWAQLRKRILKCL